MGGGFLLESVQPKRTNQMSILSIESAGKTTPFIYTYQKTTNQLYQHTSPANHQGGEVKRSETNLCRLMFHFEHFP
jgi:hypothetical protein